MYNVDEDALLAKILNEISIGEIFGCPCDFHAAKCHLTCPNKLPPTLFLRDAGALVQDFKLKLLESRKHNFEHEVLAFLLEQHFTARHIRYTIEKGTEFFRARKVDDSCNIQKMPPFNGLSAEESFVPPRKKVSSMRANVAYHTVLYGATDEKTACYEVRANKDDTINICRIKANRDLYLFNLSDFKRVYKAGGTDHRTATGLFISALLSELFSQPVEMSTSSEEYIVTQYLAEFIKNIPFHNTQKENESVKRDKTIYCPYDGILYNSQFTTGYNYCIFDFDDCEPIASKLLKVADLVFSEV